MESVNYSVGITTSGKPSFLIFPDKPTKEAYVSAEYKHCSGEYQAYCAAMNKNDRATTFARLSVKRAQFARGMGYEPSSVGSDKWTKRSNQDPKLVG